MKVNGIMIIKYKIKKSILNNIINLIKLIELTLIKYKFYLII